MPAVLPPLDNASRSRNLVSVPPGDGSALVGDKSPTRRREKPGPRGDESPAGGRAVDRRRVDRHGGPDIAFPGKLQTTSQQQQQHMSPVREHEFVLQEAAAEQNRIYPKKRKPKEIQSYASVATTDDDNGAHVYRDTGERRAGRPKNVLFYTNGKPHVKGVSVKITNQRYHSLADLMKDLTRTMKLPFGVRKVYTPEGGTEVEQIGEIDDGKAYLCASFERFKPGLYGQFIRPDWASVGGKVRTNAPTYQPFGYPSHHKGGGFRQFHMAKNERAGVRLKPLARSEEPSTGGVGATVLQQQHSPHLGAAAAQRRKAASLKSSWGGMGHNDQMSGPREQPRGLAQPLDVSLKAGHRSQRLAPYRRVRVVADEDPLRFTEISLSDHVGNSFEHFLSEVATRLSISPPHLIKLFTLRRNREIRGIADLTRLAEEDDVLVGTLKNNISAKALRMIRDSVNNQKKVMSSSSKNDSGFSDADFFETPADYDGGDSSRRAGPDLSPRTGVSQRGKAGKRKDTEKNQAAKYNRLREELEQEELPEKNQELSRVHQRRLERERRERERLVQHEMEKIQEDKRKRRQLLREAEKRRRQENHRDLLAQADQPIEPQKERSERKRQPVDELTNLPLGELEDKEDEGSDHDVGSDQEEAERRKLQAVEEFLEREREKKELEAAKLLEEEKLLDQLRLEAQRVEQEEMLKKEAAAKKLQEEEEERRRKAKEEEEEAHRRLKEEAEENERERLRAEKEQVEAEKERERILRELALACASSASSLADEPETLISSQQQEEEGEEALGIRGKECVLLPQDVESDMKIRVHSCESNPMDTLEEEELAQDELEQDKVIEQDNLENKIFKESISREVSTSDDSCGPAELSKEDLTSCVGSQRLVDHVNKSPKDKSGTSLTSNNKELGEIPVEGNEHEMRIKEQHKLEEAERLRKQEEENLRLMEIEKRKLEEEEELKRKNKEDEERKIAEDQLKKENEEEPEVEAPPEKERKMGLILPLYEDEEVMERYELVRKLGDGNFAIVYQATLKSGPLPPNAPPNASDFAAKKIDKSKVVGKIQMLKNEIAILQDCQHPNICQLYEVFETPSHVYLIMEYVKDGDLFDAISANIKFGETQAAIIIRNLAEALDYLHQRKIVHRDIKPENLLIEKNEKGRITRVKLADFGLAMTVQEKIFAVCGTPTYVAPEILAETGYGLEVDNWAAGVIAYILMCGFPPFRSIDRNQDELFDTIQRGEFDYISPYWDKISDVAKDLIDQLLVVQIKKRMKAKDVLKHQFISRQPEFI